MAISKTQKATLNGLIHEILLLRDKACLRCKNPQFQASHIYPKGSYRKLEFDPDNIKALCYKCHIHWWHKNPIEAHEWLKTVIPQARLARIKMRSQTTGDGMRDYKLLKIMLDQDIKKLEQNGTRTYLYKKS